jgi:anti-sigma B factor antagonist
MFDSTPPNPDDPLEAREMEFLSSLSDAEPETPLTITSALRNGVRVLRLEGELDVATATDLDRDLAAFSPGEANGVVVDLSRTSYVDSKGLMVLLKAAVRLDGRLAVVSTRERITRLFEMTGLTERLRLCKSLPEAVDSLRN